MINNDVNPGDYSVIFTLSDGTDTTTYVLNVEVQENSAPEFKDWSRYWEVEFDINDNTVVYDIPVYSDQEGENVYVYVDLLETASFAEFDSINNSIIFDPKDPSITAGYY